MMDAAATCLLAARDHATQVAPLSDADPGLTMAQGYAIAAAIHARRGARGESALGRKIGFTNCAIWPIYDVDAPLWGWVYDSTLHRLPDDGRPIPLPALPEPRLEPEIAFRLCRAPVAGMIEAELAGCIDAVAHGFELVFSPYPGWRFRAPDCAAAFGLHGALYLGPWQEPGALLADGGAALSALAITLDGPGRTLRGRGSDVLGGPLQALRFLIEDLARSPGAPPLGASEIDTTGTLTDAAPVAPGQTWTSRFDSAALPGATIAFAAP